MYDKHPQHERTTGIMAAHARQLFELSDRHRRYSTMKQLRPDQHEVAMMLYGMLTQLMGK